LDIVGRGKQGVRRRIDARALRVIDIVAALGRIGVPARDAVTIVTSIVDAASAPLVRARYLSLEYDRAAHDADLDQRLREATERVISRRRGRQPRR
jgi:hypothetical protein